MKTLSAGPAGVRDVGSVHDCAPDEARTLVARGYAVALDAPAKARETVQVAPAPEATTDAEAEQRETAAAAPSPARPARGGGRSTRGGQ